MLGDLPPSSKDTRLRFPAEALTKHAGIKCFCTFNQSDHLLLDKFLLLRLKGVEVLAVNAFWQQGTHIFYSLLRSLSDLKFI
mgnify:CR=1 FL=1